MMKHMMNNSAKTGAAHSKKMIHRINKSGRPKTFEELRRTADLIASEMIPGPNGEMISRGELLLRSWIKSKNPLLQRSFVEYWVGNPADRIELDPLAGKSRFKLILRYEHECPEHPDLRPPRPSTRGT